MKAKGKKYMSILDLKDGYWQCVLPHHYRKYFAFSVAEGQNKGHYEFCGLVQGFKDSQSVFQRFMNEMIAELGDENIGAYVDDIYVFNDTYENHMNALESLFKVLLKNNLTVSLKKC